MSFTSARLAVASWAQRGPPRDRVLLARRIFGVFLRIFIMRSSRRPVVMLTTLHIVVGVLHLGAGGPRVTQGPSWQAHRPRRKVLNEATEKPLEKPPPPAFFALLGCRGV